MFESYFTQTCLYEELVTDAQVPEHGDYGRPTTNNRGKNSYKDAVILQCRKTKIKALVSNSNGQSYKKLDVYYVLADVLVVGSKLDSKIISKVDDITSLSDIHNHYEVMFNE